MFKKSFVHQLLQQSDHKLVLFYRFNIVVILINIFAVLVDIFLQRYENALVESVIIVLLFINVIYLQKKEDLRKSAYIFITVISIGLFFLIFINHFATMSIVFVLLLPLTILLFVSLKESLIIMLIMFFVLVSLLSVEYLNNPNNPLFQNSQALFTLGYTATIIYIFGFLYHFSILKTFDELDKSSHQKELLLKEVHHRVKNNLNIIASIIGLQSNALDGKEKEELLKSKVRIESIAIVHEMLYKHDDFASIDVTEYLQRLSKLLLSMYSNGKNINVNINCEVKNMPLEVMVQLGIMVNELFTNSIKYAFENKQGSINIDFYAKNNKYDFLYSDDGKGYENPKELLKSKSLGIKLIHLTAKQLNGTVAISNNKGLVYKVEFKL